LKAAGDEVIQREWVTDRDAVEHYISESERLLLDSVREERNRSSGARATPLPRRSRLALHA
jgi:hypothetical protein